MRTTAAAGRDRAREGRLKAVQARRRALDPVALAREQRIDEAVLDLEDAWLSRGQALVAVERAESLAADAIRRLAGEGVAASEVAHLSGLELGTVRRLRRRRQSKAGGPSPPLALGGGAASRTVEGAHSVAGGGVACAGSLPTTGSTVPVPLRSLAGGLHVWTVIVSAAVDPGWAATRRPSGTATQRLWCDQQLVVEYGEVA